MILTATMSLISLQAFSFQLENHELNEPTAQSSSNNNSIGLAPDATPPTPMANGTSGAGAPPPGLPIDGFLGYFLVAGAIFGVRKLRKKN